MREKLNRLGKRIIQTWQNARRRFDTLEAIRDVERRSVRSCLIASASIDDYLDGVKPSSRRTFMAWTWVYAFWFFFFTVLFVIYIDVPFIYLLLGFPAYLL